MDETTVLARLGGEQTVRAAVADLYGRILDDDAISGFFDDVDLPRLQSHMTDFLVAALTGAASGYSGRPLDVAHAGVRVTDAAFDRVASHLNEVLIDAGTDAATAAAVIGLIGPLRPLVVGR